MAKQIIVDPAKLEQVSSQMETQIGEYEAQYKLLFNEVEGLGSAWQGADNIAFVTQIKGFMDDFEQMKMLMEEYATFLKESAKAYRATQNEIIDQAKSLAN